MANWTADDIPSQIGRRAVVTGPSGLGFETALGLARAGGSVVLAGRDPTTGNAAVARIRQLAPTATVSFQQLDLASLGSVAELGKRLRGAGHPVDLLVNNAGVMTPPVRRTTADGLELQFGTNYLGHFALTAALLPLLQRGHEARVVSLGSVSANGAAIDFADLQSVRRYRATPAYGQSKLAMLLFALELQRRSDRAGWGLRSLAAHPGLARTGLIAKGPGRLSLLGFITATIGPLIQQSAARGALPTLRAATDPAAKGGSYYGPDGRGGIGGWPDLARLPPQAEDAAVAARLWDISERLANLQFGTVARAA